MTELNIALLLTKYLNNLSLVYTVNQYWCFQKIFTLLISNVDMMMNYSC